MWRNRKQEQRLRISDHSFLNLAWFARYDLSPDLMQANVHGVIQRRDFLPLCELLG